MTTTGRVSGALATACPYPGLTGHIAPFTLNGMFRDQSAYSDVPAPAETAEGRQWQGRCAGEGRPSSAERQERRGGGASRPFRSTKGASKQRRDLINAEISLLRGHLPLAEPVRARLSYLQVMSLTCVYMRKCNFFSREVPESQSFLPGQPEVAHAALQGLHGFLLVTTREGKMLYISENVTEHLGHSMVDLLSQGDCVYDIIDPADHLTVQNNILQTPFTTTGSTMPSAERSFFCRMKTSRTMRRQTNYGDNKIVHVRGHFQVSPAGWIPNPIFVSICLPIDVPSSFGDLPMTFNTNTFHSVHGLDMKFKEVSDSLQFLLGFDGTALTGQSWYSMMHPDFLQLAGQQHKHLLDQSRESGTMFVARMNTAGGDWTWVHVLMQLRALDINSEELSIICMNTVISEDEVSLYEAQCRSFSQFTSSLQHQEDPLQTLKVPPGSPSEPSPSWYGQPPYSSHSLSSEFSFESPDEISAISSLGFEYPDPTQPTTMASGFPSMERQDVTPRSLKRQLSEELPLKHEPKSPRMCQYGDTTKQKQHAGTTTTTMEFLMGILPTPTEHQMTSPPFQRGFTWSSPTIPSFASLMASHTGAPALNLPESTTPFSPSRPSLQGFFPDPQTTTDVSLSSGLATGGLCVPTPLQLPPRKPPATTSRPTAQTELEDVEDSGSKLVPQWIHNMPPTPDTPTSHSCHVFLENEGPPAKTDVLPIPECVLTPDSTSTSPQSLNDFSDDEASMTFTFDSPDKDNDSKSTLLSKLGHCSKEDDLSEDSLSYYSKHKAIMSNQDSCVVAPTCNPSEKLPLKMETALDEVTWNDIENTVTNLVKAMDPNMLQTIYTAVDMSSLAPIQEDELDSSTKDKESAVRKPPSESSSTHSWHPAPHRREHESPRARVPSMSDLSRLPAAASMPDDTSFFEELLEGTAPHIDKTTQDQQFHDRGGSNNSNHCCDDEDSK
ncbi:neuronal PAS domain-containing protein 4-like [Branchiostoma lanceolatum]|uniref:neuronal PAS domain-containing protein 4-like n=1 Tax=Branchiostoma lanceolatum TaxID=7740 RepID=UPI0034565267